MNIQNIPTALLPYDRTLQKEVVEDNFGSDFLFNGKSRNDSFIELDKIWTFIACCGFSIRPEGLIKQHHSNSCLCITETPHFYAIDLSSWQYINMFLETFPLFAGLLLEALT